MRHRSSCAVTVLASLFALACAASKDRIDSARAGSMAGSVAAAAVSFGPTAYGPIRMCAPIDSVSALASRIGAASVRDTVIESEGERWPAKLVALGDGGIALFESSWTDTTHVWRFSTTSQRARTAHGARVEATVGELPAGSGPFRAEISEGAVRIVLAGDSVGARVDTASERAVQASSATDRDVLHALPEARVIELVATGRCTGR